MKLPTEHQAWLDAHIQSGEFASVDEALSQLIAERIAAEHEDLAWAKPFVEAGKEAVRQGDVIELSVHKSRNAARLAALGK